MEIKSTLEFLNNLLSKRMPKKIGQMNRFTSSWINASTIWFQFNWFVLGESPSTYRFLCLFWKWHHKNLDKKHEKEMRSYWRAPALNVLIQFKSYDCWIEIKLNLIYMKKTLSSLIHRKKQLKSWNKSEMTNR